MMAGTGADDLNQPLILRQWGEALHTRSEARGAQWGSPPPTLKASTRQFSSLTRHWRASPRTAKSMFGPNPSNC